MSILHTYIPNRVIDDNGIADGASLAFYLTGTLTPASIYSDAGLTTPLANPVVVPSGAQVPAIYLDEAIDYRRIVTYSDGSTEDVDPYVEPFGVEANRVRSDLASPDDGKGVGLVEFNPDAEYTAGSAGKELQRMDRPKRMKRAKWFVSADWQARPEEANEIAAVRAMMDDIEEYHPDIDWALLLGDIVDRATDNDTGAEPSYGFDALFEDMRTRIPSLPWARWLPLAGNHDRDGTGSSGFRDAWTYNTYRNKVGPLWYYADHGNMRFIFLSDMAGSNTGEILDVAIEWFAEIMKRSSNFNVFVCMHQPPDPTVYPPQTDPDGQAFQRDPERLTDIIEDYDNVTACFYGHVGGSANNSTLVTEAYGTTWINVQMGTPSAINGSGGGFDMMYSIMEAEAGSDQISVRRWSATAHDWANLNDVTLTSKFPIELGGDQLDFNGKYEVDPLTSYVRGPHVIYQSAADFRDYTTPFSVATGTPLILQKIILGDDGNNNVSGQYVATGYYVPGAPDGVVDDDGFPVVATPAYGLGGTIGFTRTESDDTNYESCFTVTVAKNDGTQETGFKHYASTDSRKGLRVLTGDIALSETDLDPSVNDGITGFQVNRANGILNVAASNTAVRIGRKVAGAGNAIAFYHVGSVSGTVQVNGPTTTYNTSCDAILKNDKGELSYEDALEVMRLITIHNFEWKETGQDAVGVFAQELYEVFPRAVAKGGWVRDDENGQNVPAEEGDEGAYYMPWGVDYSKLIPVIIRVIQGLIPEQATK